jgi:hypothetical protein
MATCRGQEGCLSCRQTYLGVNDACIRGWLCLLTVGAQEDWVSCWSSLIAGST